ncbi:carbon-nitrogen hydrolase family protein [Guyparkeria hydrothermalis]|uniref:carbon-nitrogen hydrolase family protein n=1 Tax=Guyparkeria hydrothermalis TaxID=923 RepID=UPI00202129C6|nr:carbon-nitrogen hydrolase family protein [Guyparkeria hydrothermalis]MCL7743520.1 carbon-nitrogen hydrolase family protein [Guyparkeria hydrothermalis]
MPMTIRVGAIQMKCLPGRVNHNLDHAEELVRQAADQGASLVLLPELMPNGYMLVEAIWDTAETISGEVVGWLLRTARRFGIYLGFSFLEAEGEDFYNAFVLANPAGELLGRVRKEPPASVESYFYTAGNDRHVIETAIGRIGVAICYENLLFDRISFLQEAHIDLVLAPFAALRPRAFIPGDIKRFDAMLLNMRSIHSRTLGVPMVMADQVGLLRTELPGHLPDLRSSFPGLSCIVDADGTVKKELGDEEGVIVSDVSVGGKNGQAKGFRPRKYGKIWSVPVPWYAFTWPMSQRWGEKSYATNPRRRARAVAISGRVEERVVLPGGHADSTQARG